MHMRRLLAALALPHLTTARECYATILYGPQLRHPCLAAVLGAALSALDPGRPRVALVHNLSARAAAVVGAHWEAAPLTWRGAAGRKVDLFGAPAGCDRVLYVDADSFPRTERVGALFALEGGLWATRQGRTYENYKKTDDCLNGGFLRVDRDTDLRDRYSPESPFFLCSSS